jgi:hypothetical protein
MSFSATRDGPSVTVDFFTTENNEKHKNIFGGMRKETKSLRFVAYTIIINDNVLLFWRLLGFWSF